MKRFFDKHLILKYIFYSFVKVLVYVSIGVISMFIILEITGVYGKLDNMLDLKYYSPWVIAPIIISAVIALFSFFAGLIFYLYKYKRSVTKGTFYKALSDVLNKK